MSEFDNVGFDELKEMYKVAVADKEKAEARIESIRQAFKKELDELEEIKASLGLDDAPSNTEKTSIVDKVKPYTNILTNTDNFITIDFRRIFGFIMSYILPIIVVALLVFAAVKVLHRPMKVSLNDGVVIEQEIQVVDDGLGELWYE